MYIYKRWRHELMYFSATGLDVSSSLSFFIRPVPMRLASFYVFTIGPSDSLFHFPN